MTRSLKELKTGSALCLLSAIGVAAIPQFAAAQTTVDVGVYRGNVDRSGYVDAAIHAPLSVIWQNTGQATDEAKSGPVSDSGMVYYATGHTVYCVDEADGGVIWKYPATDDTNDPDVREPGFFHGPPCAADGKVFIGNDDGYLYVLDEKTGEDVFQVKTGGPIRSAPVVDNGIVYFGSLDGKVYDIREDNQQPQWGGNFKTNGPSGAPGSPVLGPVIVTDDQVIFSDTNDTIYAAAKATGRLLWDETIQSGVVDDAPIIANGNVVIASDKYLIGLSHHNGQEVWRATLPALATNQPATNVDGTEFYVATGDNFLNAVDQRGHIFWRAQVGSAAASGPMVIGNSVILTMKSGSIYDYDAATGAVKWSYNTNAITPPTGPINNRNGASSCSPLVLPDKLFVLTNDSTLTAFSSKGADQVPPVAKLLYPVLTEDIPGDQIPYQISLIDTASGVDPSSVVLKVDSKIVPTDYTVGTQQITVKAVSGDQLYGTTPVRLATLTMGPHTLTLTAADWRGNTVTQTWRFNVDSKLNARGASLPASTSGDYATASGTDSEFSADSGNGSLGGTTGGGAGGSDSSGGNGSGGDGGGGGLPTTGGGGGSNNSGGSNNGGGGTPPTPQTPANPQPPVNGGGGGGNMPPPPPI